jgi:hypothetical protein
LILGNNLCQGLAEIVALSSRYPKLFQALPFSILFYARGYNLDIFANTGRQ